MSEIGLVILSALGGALVSGLSLSLTFVMTVGAKLSSITSDVKAMTRDIAELKKDIKAIQSGQFPCQYHTEIVQTAGRLDERVKTLEKSGG